MGRWATGATRGPGRVSNPPQVHNLPHGAARAAQVGAGFVRATGYAGSEAGTGKLEACATGGSAAAGFRSGGTVKEFAVWNCGQVVTLGGPARARVGGEMRELAIIRDGALLVRDGRIAAVGTRAEIERAVGERETRLRRVGRPGGLPHVVDAGGGVVLPGFVDAHTHPVFGGNRADEYEMRAEGATYAEIAERGGGIRSTVRRTREASEDELVAAARRYRTWFLRGGTTTIEAKSGYGLTVEAELKMLRAIRQLNGEGSLRYVPTFLGAHEVPDEFRGRTRDYAELVIEEMLPRVAGRQAASGGPAVSQEPATRSRRVAEEPSAGRHAAPGGPAVSNEPATRSNRVGEEPLAGRHAASGGPAVSQEPATRSHRVAEERLAEYCDVFCEPSVFPRDEARAVLQAARACGLGLRVHADQFTADYGSMVAAEVGAATADHLEAATEAGLRALREAGVQPVVLPASVYALGLTRYPAARRMIELGMAVVLATDFNPGSSPTASMPMVLSLASTQLKMTPAEAITAATINAAYSLGRGGEIGSLEVGKRADFAIHEAADYREIAYFFGRETARAVYIGGERMEL